MEKEVNILDGLPRVCLTTKKVLNWKRSLPREVPSSSKRSKPLSVIKNTMIEKNRTEIEAYWEDLNLLTETGQNIVEKNDDSLTARCLYVILKIAIENTDTNLLKSCISLGIPLDKSNFSGLTPLMMCIEQDSPELVRQIIELGADVNQRTNHYDSPLHFGVIKNKLKGTEALLKLGKKHNLSLNFVGTNGMAPLHKAAKLHLKDMISLLVKNGADVNVKGENGSTPLHIAASCRAM